jgi:hypothetical protein
MILEQYFESFAGDLAIEKEVFMVQDEQDGGSTGLEVLQVAPLDTKCTLASVILNLQSIVVNLGEVREGPIVS